MFLQNDNWECAMNWLKRLFGFTKDEYHPVTQWLIQGEFGWHNNNWSER